MLRTIRCRAIHTPFAHKPSVVTSTLCFHFPLQQTLLQTFSPAVAFRPIHTLQSTQYRANWTIRIARSTSITAFKSTHNPHYHRSKRVFWGFSAIGCLALIPLLHLESGKDRTLEDIAVESRSTQDAPQPYNDLIDASDEIPLNSPLAAIRILSRVITIVAFLTPVLLTYPIWWYMNRSRLQNNEEVKVWWVWYLVWTLERLGPLFIKLGQWASSRSDILPPEICAVLSKLQNRVKPHSLADTKKSIQTLYGKAMEDVFDEFDALPVGTGAVADVYRGLLKATEKTPPFEVAIKVLRPNIRTKVSIDLLLLTAIGRLLSLVPGAKYLSISEELATFGRMMRNQMDLRIEARNLESFLDNFEGLDAKGKRKGVANVTFPKPLKWNRDVLVETFHRGLLLRELLENGPTPFDQQLADIGVNAFMVRTLDSMAQPRAAKPSYLANDLT